MAKETQFYQVRSASAHGSQGNFRRAGIDFTRNSWRAIKLGEVDGEVGGITIVTPETLALLEAEPLLAVKPASEKAIGELVKSQGQTATDPASALIALQEKVAELEGKLMSQSLAKK